MPALEPGSLRISLRKANLWPEESFLLSTQFDSFRRRAWGDEKISFGGAYSGLSTSLPVPGWPLRHQRSSCPLCHVSGYFCSESLPKATVRSEPAILKQVESSSFQLAQWASVLSTPDQILAAAAGGRGGGGSGGPALPLLSLCTRQRSSGWNPAGKGTSTSSVPDPGTLLISHEVQFYRFSHCYDAALFWPV